MKMSRFLQLHRPATLLAAAALFITLLSDIGIAFCPEQIHRIPDGAVSRSRSDKSTATCHFNWQQQGYQSSKETQRQLKTALSMSNQFDVSKPVFDLLSFRSIRGDAMIRYDSMNQSEPLRITLFGLFCIAFLIAPTFTEAVGYDPMTTPAVAASVLGTLGSGGLFARECSRRANQLSRIEKELNTERLPVRLPTNQFAEMPYSQPVTLKELRTTTTYIKNSQQPPRLIAICGSKAKLQEALNSLAVYGQRLKQASTFVVAISTDGSSEQDWQTLEDRSAYRAWLADAYQPQMWRDYFQELSAENNESEFRWFGLTARGQSWGSGDGVIPQWMQVLGQFLRPTDFLDDDIVTSADDSSKQELLDNLQLFYKALTTGDEDGIKSVYSSSPSIAVTEVTTAGGRIDSWNNCLAEGARPSDMKVSGADATIFSDTEAYTTVVEFPANTGFDSASLLAVQKWTRDDKNKPWKLQLHQTIPWSLETKAQGTLRCDCRGCVALTRGPERRTFGGVIG